MMLTSLLRRSLCLLVFTAWLCGCAGRPGLAETTATPGPAATATGAAIAMATDTPAPSPLSTAAHSPTTRLASPTWEASLTPSQTAPAATATPVSYTASGERLVGRQPSFREINKIILAHNSYFKLPEESLFERVDLNKDGALDFFFRNTASDGELFVDEWEVSVLFHDVNGDGEADLFIYGGDGIALFLWDEDGYATTILEGPFWGRAIATVVTASFMDLTADGTDEILLDMKIAGGGTGLWTFDTTRTIFHCRAMSCRVAWEGMLRYEVSDYNAGGFALTEREFRPLPDKAAFEVSSSSFAISCCFDVFEVWTEGWEVTPSTLSTYTWNGEAFVLTAETTTSPGSSVESLDSLLAKNRTGERAAIIHEPNRSLGNKNDVCTLFVEGEMVGAPFGCNSRFTSVGWQDLTGDGVEEVVITAFSAGWPYDRDGNSLDNIECMHQRLLAYQWWGGAATLIANETGCVEDKTLFGVRLEDVNQDGRPEIVAAANDQQPRRTLRWNGREFVE